MYTIISVLFFHYISFIGKQSMCTKQGKGFTATAETEIKDRTQYDIVFNSAKFKAASALGDKLINDNIKIQLDIKTN